MLRDNWILFVEPPASICSRKWADPAISSGSWFEPYSTATESCVVFAFSCGKSSTVRPFESFLLRQKIGVSILKTSNLPLKKLKAIDNGFFMGACLFLFTFKMEAIQKQSKNVPQTIIKIHVPI
jgi:hypothetical protein